MKKKNWVKPMSVTAFVLVIILFLYSTACDMDIRSRVAGTEKRQENFVRLEEIKGLKLKINRLEDEIASLKSTVRKIQEELVLSQEKELIIKVRELEQEVEKLKEEIKKKKRSSLWWLNPFNWI